MKNKIINKIFPAVAVVATALPIASLTSCVLNSKNKGHDSKDPTLPTIKLKESKVISDVQENNVSEPLTFTNESTSATVGCHVSFPEDSEFNGLKFQYKILKHIEESDWVDINQSENETLIELPPTYGIQFKAVQQSKDNAGKFSNQNHQIRINFDECTDDNAYPIRIGGSLLSLLSYTNEDGEEVAITELDPEKSQHCFDSLFNLTEPTKWSRISSVSPCLLPYKKLAPYCYSNMFGMCKHLMTPPILPAEELVEGCYDSMFSSCDKLTSINLPARKLAKNCYHSLLFNDWETKLITLGYVGNFVDDYFNDWVCGINQGGSNTRTIYYCGEDKTVSDHALPQGFTVKTLPHIMEKTTVLTFVEDQNKTGTLSNTAKNKVRAYNDQKFSDLDIATTVIPQYVTDKGDVSKWFHKDSTGKYTEIEGINDYTVENLPGTTLAPKFGFGEVVELKDYTQIEVEEASTIRYGDYTAAAGNVQVAEYVAGKEITDLDWKDLPYLKSYGTYETLTLEKNKRYILRGTIKNTATNKTNIRIVSGKVNIAGNALSLIRSEISGENPTELKDYAFDRLFAESTGIKSVSPTFLCDENGNPFALKPMCYSSMFNGCTNLLMDAEESTPESERIQPIILGATTSAGGCYNEMFCGCKKIKTAPTICFTADNVLKPHKETNMSYGACRRMFEGCTSLVSANYTLYPEKIGASSYDHMFKGCTALKNAPSINAHIMEDSSEQDLGACAYMFEKCFALEKAAPFSYAGDGPWTAGKYAMCGMYYMGDSRDNNSLLNTPPELKFSFSNNTYVYRDMFKGCCSLDISSSSGTGKTMFFNPKDLGTCSDNSTGWMFAYTKNWKNKNDGKCPYSNRQYYFI